MWKQTRLNLHQHESLYWSQRRIDEQDQGVVEAPDNTVLQSRTRPAQKKLRLLRSAFLGFTIKLKNQYISPVIDHSLIKNELPEQR